MVHRIYIVQAERDCEVAIARWCGRGRASLTMALYRHATLHLDHDSILASPGR